MVMHKEWMSAKASANVSSTAGEIVAMGLILLGLAAFLAGGIAIAVVLDWLINALAHVPLPALGR
jgi:hypothetical protein